MSRWILKMDLLTRGSATTLGGNSPRTTKGLIHWALKYAAIIDPKDLAMMT